MDQNTAVPGQHWVENFVRRNGRKPRVLHVGNIANNAYVNSKLLNEIGFESDVLCYNYYHIMGYPEWEDADFIGQPKDAFYPNWSEVKMAPFRRPRWFAQGSLEHCIDYLIARRNGDRPSAYFNWAKMEVWRWVHSRHSDFVMDVFESLQRARRPGQLGIEFRAFVRRHVPKSVWIVIKTGQRMMRLLTFRPMDLPVPPSAHSGSVQSKPIEKTKPENYDPALVALLEDFKRRFPERIDQLTYEELEGLNVRAQQMKPLFECYDIVHTYSTDSIYAMLASTPAQVAYEHGTIREIPFENTITGRATALSFSRANVIFMTNADSIPQSRILQSDPRRVVFGIHGFDERRLQRRLSYLSKKLKSASRFGVASELKIFLAPARHDWDIKGNDRIIRALATVVQDFPGKFKVVFADWGQDVRRSKELITALALDSYVVWTAPIGKSQLHMSYRHVDAVIDQFLLPCIGNVTIEALAIGECPVMTSLDQTAMTDFYGEALPLLNCVTAEEIASRMREVLASDDKNKEVRESCLRWMSKHHSYKRLVENLITAYDLALEDIGGKGRVVDGQARSWLMWLSQNSRKMLRR